jgi:hypothetical protein
MKPDPFPTSPAVQDTIGNPPAKRRALAEKTNDTVPVPAPVVVPQTPSRIKQEPRTYTFHESRGVELIKPEYSKEIKDELIEVTSGPWGTQIPLFSAPEVKEEKKVTIQGGLFLGNIDVAHNQTWQDDVEIKAVVNAAVELKEMKYDPKSSFMLHLVDEDKTKLDGPEVEKALDFIDSQRRVGNSVLVHCKMGQSRSVSIVILYMIKRCGMRLSECMFMLDQNAVKNTLKMGMMQSLMDADKLIHGINSHDFFSTSTRKAKMAALQLSPWIETKENTYENRSRTAPSTPKRATPRKPLGAKRVGAAAAKSTLSSSKAKKPKKTAAAKASQKSGSSALPSQFSGQTEKPASPNMRQPSLQELLNKLRDQAPLFKQTTEDVSLPVDSTPNEDATLGSLL